MSNIQIVKNHIALTACPDIEQICEPLYKLGIMLFIYQKIYDNGTKIVLSNNRAWNEHYFDRFYQLAYRNSVSFESLAPHDCQLFLSRELFPQVEAFADATERFNFGNAIVITRQQNTAKELFYFAANIKNIAVNHHYINNLELFYTFINYFKDKAGHLINRSEKSRIVIPCEYLASPLTNTNPEYASSVNVNKEVWPLLKSNKTFFIVNGNEIYLTKQQMECAKWLIRGKSAKEMAIIMSLSKRTIEEHITNMKTKFNCYKITQLIYILSKHSYLFEH